MWCYIKGERKSILWFNPMICSPALNSRLLVQFGTNLAPRLPAETALGSETLRRLSLRCNYNISLRSSSPQGTLVHRILRISCCIFFECTRSPYTTVYLKILEWLVKGTSLIRWWLWIFPKRDLSVWPRWPLLTCCCAIIYFADVLYCVFDYLLSVPTMKVRNMKWRKWLA